MIKKNQSIINHSSNDDLMIGLADLKPLMPPDDHIALIEKKMLKAYIKQRRKTIQNPSSLFTCLQTAWELSIIMIAFVFLGWDVFSIISYLLRN